MSDSYAGNEDLGDKLRKLGIVLLLFVILFVVFQFFSQPLLLSQQLSPSVLEEKINTCNARSGMQQITGCIESIAISTGNSTVCTSLPDNQTDTDSPSVSKTCFKDVAIALQKPSYCQNALTQETFGCYTNSMSASKQDVLGECALVTNFYEKQTCFVAAAAKFRDEKICNQAPKKDLCEKVYELK